MASSRDRLNQTAVALISVPVAGGAGYGLARLAIKVFKLLRK